MLGFPILYCKGMWPMMFQLSGFCYRLWKCLGNCISMKSSNVASYCCQGAGILKPTDVQTSGLRFRV